MFIAILEHHCFVIEQLYVHSRTVRPYVQNSTHCQSSKYEDITVYVNMSPILNNNDLWKK